MPELDTEPFVDKLASLGTTADEIAASLKALGIEGTPYDSCLCPLAVYLTQTTGIRVTVSEVCVTIRPEHEHFRTFMLTRGQSVFVKRFDKCKYPALLRRYQPPTP